MEEKRLTDQEKIDVVNYYLNDKFDCAKISRFYGVNPNSIRSLIRNRGIPLRNDQSMLKRKYSLNQDYFEKIDTEDKAYFLGLMYSDGYNYETNNKICISLQTRDRHILEKFKECISYSGPLLYLPQRQGKKDKYIKREQWVLTIRSKKLCEQLANLGCIQKKSLILKFPTDKQVPIHLLHHFIRGYIDGDGCLVVKLRKNSNHTMYSVCLISTEMFCESLRKKLKELIQVESSIISPSKKSNIITKRMNILGGRNGKKRFLDWIYEGATIYLSRKYEKYLLF